MRAEKLDSISITKGFNNIAIGQSSGNVMWKGKAIPRSEWIKMQDEIAEASALRHLRQRIERDHAKKHEYIRKARKYQRLASFVKGWFIAVSIFSIIYQILFS